MGTGRAAPDATDPAGQALDALEAADAGPTAIRGSALRSLGYIVGVALTLVSAPLLVRHLGVDGFGDYVTVTALVAIVAGLSDAGLTNVGVREFAAGDEGGSVTLMRELLGARIVLTSAAAVLAIAFAALAGYGDALVLGTALSCAGLLAQSYASALSIPLVATLRQGWVSVIEVVRQAITVVLIVVLILAGAGIVPLLAATIPAGLLAVAATARLAARGYWWRPICRPRAWWSRLREALPFAAATAVGVVYFRVTMIVMSIVAAAEAGAFATAFRVVEALVGVPVLLVGAIFPLLAHSARRDRARLRYALQRSFEVALVAGGLAALLLVAGAPLAIQVLAGEQIEEAIDALRILGLGLGFSFVGTIGQFGLLSLHRHRAILVVNLAALVLNAALTAALAPAWGAVGGATALTVSEAFLAVVSVWVLLSTLSMRLALGVVPRLALVTAAAAGAAFAASSVGIVAAPLAGLLVYAAGAVALRIVPDEVWAAARLSRGGAPG
jgi:O-antigen/teichoic acid export membrane protein